MTRIFVALILAALPVCRGYGNAHICNDARGQVIVCCQQGT